MQNFEQRLRTVFVRQEGRHLSDIIFRNWVTNVSNQNWIYYRLFWCWHNFFYIENKQSYNYFEKHAFFLCHPVETRDQLVWLKNPKFLPILS